MDEKVYIFVSHSHNDIDKVRVIRNYLEEIGAEPILFFLKSKTDKDEISQLIKDEIDARLWFIYCDSENARLSDWVKAELDYIKETNKITNFTLDLNKSFEKEYELSVFAKEKIQRHILNIKNNRRFFVSYSRADYFVCEMIKLLKQYGIDLIGDDDTFSPNPHFKMKDMIDMSKYFLMFITKNSVRSLFFIDELHYALSNNKVMIPVYIGILFEDLKPDVKLLIGDIQGIWLSSDSINKAAFMLMDKIVHFDE